MNSKIVRHFKKKDPILFGYLKQVGPIGDLQGDLPKNYFFRICKEIVGQQLSSKAGYAIFSRFKNIFSKFVGGYGFEIIHVEFQRFFGH